MSRVMPNSGLQKIQAIVMVTRCKIDPITRARTAAAKLIMWPRNQPMSGIHLKSAIIGEKSKYMPMQNRNHPLRRNTVERQAFVLFRSDIICLFKTFPGYITFTTSWNPYLKHFATHPQIQQQPPGPSSSLASASVQLPLSSPHGVSIFSGFHCLKDVVPLSSIFIY